MPEQNSQSIYKKHLKPHCYVAKFGDSYLSGRPEQRNCCDITKLTEELKKKALRESTE